jgi:hypothetical protein
MRNAVVDQFVVANYSNCRIYQIKEIDFTKNPLSKLVTKDGDELTYHSYYLKTYKINIADKNQPLLLAKAKSTQ